MKKKNLIILATLVAFFGVFTSCSDSDDPIKIENISLDLTEHVLKLGESLQLTATTNPATTDEKLTWISSDESKATVDQNGLVKSVAAGAVDITVSNEDGTIKAVCEITVFDPPFPEELLGTWKATKVDVYNGEELYEGYPEYAKDYVRNTFLPKLVSYDDIQIGLHPSSGFTPDGHIFLSGEIEADSEQENMYVIYLDWEGKENIGNFTPATTPSLGFYYDGETLYLDYDNGMVLFRVYFEVEDIEE